jgi:hypothetical protein
MSDSEKCRQKVSRYFALKNTEVWPCFDPSFCVDGILKIWLDRMGVSNPEQGRLPALGDPHTL